MTDASKVLVTDFDGTMTKYDFFNLVREQLLPAGTPNFWAEYRAGRRTHFEGLQGYFAAIRADEQQVLQMVDSMEFDPGIPAAIAALRQANWEIVIASAGCQWYIDYLLKKHGVAVTVFSNPGRFVNGQGLLMELPVDRPHFSPTVGVDKAGIMQHYVQQGYTVAFAGDGFPDEPAARLAPAPRRFARGDLAQALSQQHEAYLPYANWSEVAARLLADESQPC